MDPKEAREQAIRGTKEALILDAARQAFCEKGYWDTRLEDIAAAAGFSKASLYNYYPDKEAIFLTLAIREYQGIVDAVEKSLNENAGIEENLRRSLQILMTYLGQHFALVLSTMNFQATMQFHLDVCKHQVLTEGFLAQILRMNGVLRKLVSFGRARGEVHSTLDDAQVSAFISALIRGVFFDWHMASKVGDVDAAVAQVVEFTLSGIGARRQE